MRASGSRSGRRTPTSSRPPPSLLLPLPVSLLYTHSLPPYRQGILKIFDSDGVAQGMPGYANAPVAVGDQIIEVEGTPTSGMDGAQIRDALRGVEGCGPPRPPRPPHRVTLARAAQMGGPLAVLVVPSKGDGTRV